MSVYTIDITKKNFRTIFNSMIPLLTDQKLIIVQEKIINKHTTTKVLVESGFLEMRNGKDISNIVHLMSLDEFVSENGTNGTCEVIVDEQDKTVSIAKNIKNETNPEENELNILNFYTINEKGFELLEKNPFVTESNVSIPLRILKFKDTETLVKLNKDVFNVNELKFDIDALNNGLITETYKYRLVNNYFNEAVYIYHTPKYGTAMGFTSVLETPEELIERLKKEKPDIAKEPSLSVLLISTKNEWIKRANEIGLVITDTKTTGGHFLERHITGDKVVNTEITPPEDNPVVKVYNEDGHTRKKRYKLVDNIDDPLEEEDDSPATSGNPYVYVPTEEDHI